jgi:hypothetical protein
MMFSAEAALLYGLIMPLRRYAVVENLTGNSSGPDFAEIVAGCSGCGSPGDMKCSVALSSSGCAPDVRYGYRAT